jgi:hypothetical protein
MSDDLGDIIDAVVTAIGSVVGAITSDGGADTAETIGDGADALAFTQDLRRRKRAPENAQTPVLQRS